MTSKREGDDELARRVRAAYDDVLREPAPDRLKKLVAKPAPAPVIDLAAARAKRASKDGARAAWGWAQWGGMAASLALGVIAGALLVSRGGEDTLVAESGGRLVAARMLAQALDTQLAADANPRVAVHLSFAGKDGRYCRTFTADSVAGLACRDGAQWNVVTTAQAAAASGTGLRQAASPLPRAVLDAVDSRIAGNALDAAQERAARDRGWVK
jgi:hypothetical protein